MHGRHRNPGNGYRSNLMGMDRIGPGRISPDTSSLQGHGYYNNNNYNNSDPQHHRNNFNNRGGGGGFGRSKSFQHHPPPPAPPRRGGGNIFMDAGRLAAEYLVAQGLLPPSVLSSGAATKWQQKKNQQMEFESDQMREEGRASALSRLGNSSEERRYRRGRFEDYNAARNNNNYNNNNKGRRRNRGGYGPDTRPDWTAAGPRGGGDYGRSGSFSDRHSRASSEDDSATGRNEEQRISRDVGSNVWQQRESEEVVDSEAKIDRSEDMMSSSKNASSSLGGWRDNEVVVVEEPNKAADVEMKDVDCGNNDESEKQNVVAAEELQVVQVKAAEEEGNGDSVGGSDTDLLNLCKFANVPTRIRSALTTRGLKVDPLPSIQEGNSSSDIGLQLGGSSQALVDVSSGTEVLDKSHYGNCVEPEASKTESSQSVGNLIELGFCGIEQNKFERSKSLPDRAFMHETDQEMSQGPVGLRSFSFLVKDRGEKRDLDDFDRQVEAKKQRQWNPYTAAESDDCFQISNLSEKKASPLVDNTSPTEKMIVSVDHESSMGNDDHFQKGGVDTCVDFMQEKQLFPNSFDLNLMEVGDAHENRDSNPVISFPDVSGVKKEAMPVDIDLSISNSNMSRENSRRILDVKEIEVIDLENDSFPEDKAFNNAERKTGTEFVPLDGFSSQAQSSSDIPDGQDGYGLMISELLGNDFPTCSTVPEDLTPMHNDIGLPNAEGTLADDDSIYMALGEIPLTFMRPWEQPTPQEYEKPF